MTTSIQEIWKETFLILQRNSRQVLALHLFFMVTAVILFAPLTGLLGQFLLELSGQPMLADLDIVYFFLTPSGMTTAILMAAISITILVFEQTSLMAIFLADAEQRPLNTFSALLFTSRKAGAIFRYATGLVLRLLLITLPFLGMAVAIAWVMITDYDINYYLAARPPIFIIAVLSIAGILFTMTHVLLQNLSGWLLALPLILFSMKSPAGCFTESEELSHGQRKLIMATIGSWLLTGILASMLFFAALRLTTSLLAPFFFYSLSSLVTLLGVFVACWFLGNFLISTFTSGSIAAITLLFFRRQQGGTELPAMPEMDSPPGISPPRLLLMLLLALCGAVLTGTVLVNDIPTQNNTVIIAHRGAAGKAPENTLAALEQAITDGSDWIEIDVQESRDGEIIVTHDRDFMKLAGNPLQVWDGSLDEIKQLDIGSWFASQFSAERVPTLKEVLKLAEKRCRVLIELKDYGHNRHLEERVAEIVEEAGMADKIAIMSLNRDAINRFHNLRPDWPVGLLLSKAIGKISNSELDFLAVNMATAKPAFIRRLQASGRQVFVWTVNDPASMSRIMALGVDGIITDEPALAMKIRRHNREMTPVERLLIHTAALINRPVSPQTYRDNSP